MNKLLGIVFSGLTISPDKYSILLQPSKAWMAPLQAATIAATKAKPEGCISPEEIKKLAALPFPEKSNPPTSKTIAVTLAVEQKACNIPVAFVLRYVMMEKNTRITMVSVLTPKLSSG